MIPQILEQQRDFFSKGTTKDITFRKKALIRLRKAIIQQEDRICDALYKDFKKPKFEALATETQFVLAELNHMIKKIDLWTRPEKVGASWSNFPSNDYIYCQPYGTVLIIAPWNYPFQLCLAPLIGALVAGNTAVVKPSELTPNTANIIAEIISEVFDPEYVTVVQGGVEVSQALLKERWDYIFFTGSTRVGKIVYQSAAEHLTPVTLELGGKNPCIIDETANLKLTAKRICWGKFINAGQTCLAPDYLLVHHSVKNALVKELINVIEDSFGKDIQKSDSFARIAFERHFNGLIAMLEGEELLYGGNHNKEEHYLQPTLVDEPSLDSPVMEDEIFGPILPILSYDQGEDIDKVLKNYAKPLALYVFSSRRKFQKKLISKYDFGGGAINDTVVQIVNKELPFGGVGGSGIGAYHGKHSFELFSHRKGIVKRATWLDIPLRYAPYKLPVKWVKQFKRLL